MTARTDPRIPELVSLTEAAALLEASKAWVTKLQRSGRLAGRHVGHTLVFAAASVHLLAAARRAGLRGWQAPDTGPLPELLSTTETADRLGLAQRVWIAELYRRGEVPGRRVGRRTIVFAAETIAEIADEWRTGRRGHSRPHN